MARDLARRGRFRGLLLGTAVGDSLGLPAEGLSRRRIRRLHGGAWRHRFLLRRGMVSDDTEHTVFVAQSLLAHPDDVASFTRRLARSLRWWLLSLPAGIGSATLQAIARLWLGVSPSRSGVHSAGNGPAMRVAPIGALFAERPEDLASYVRSSTELTHSDPRALVGAAAVARLVAWSVREEPEARPPLELLLELLLGPDATDPEWHQIVMKLAESAQADASVAEFAERLGLERGVTGYVYHTVPVAAYAWFRHFGDFRASLSAVLDCGGDTDTVGAILGALAGSVVGEEGIPPDWLAGVVDWPRGTGLLRTLGDRLADVAAGSPAQPVRYCWPGTIPRNLVFLTLVLVHGFRRLAPPY